MSSPSNSAEPRLDLIEESLDEAAFLWRRWESELASLTRNLDEVFSWTEDRLQGALDGVRVAGPAMVDLATEFVLSDDIDRVTVCAGLLGGAPTSEAMGAISGALATAEGERLDAIVRGLEVLGTPEATGAAGAALTARGPSYAGWLCRLQAFHRVVGRDVVAIAFGSESVPSRIGALHAARYLPSSAAEECILRGLASRDPAVRNAAVQSGVARGMSDAWEAAKGFARALKPDAGSYLRLLAIFGGPAEHDIVRDALRVPDLRVRAIWALGHIGTVAAADACVAGMRQGDVARACGEAYSWITGADLAAEQLTAPEPIVEVPPFEEDDLDANLVPPPEALWPLPDPDAVSRHWEKWRSKLVPNVRHIRGGPATTKAMLAAVENGPMLRRPDVILELSGRTRGRYDVEPRALSGRQHRMMTAARAAISNDTGR